MVSAFLSLSWGSGAKWGFGFQLYVQLLAASRPSWAAEWPFGFNEKLLAGLSAQLGSRMAFWLQ